jgi:hypothetical protein
MLRPAAFLALLSPVLLIGGPVAAADPDLATLMGRMQYFAHKLGLAVSAGNPALQHFYAHEVEEVIEKVEAIEEQDGVRIADLIRGTLVPAFEALESSIDAGDADAVDGAYDRLLAACNQCHTGAKRPYIHIERRTDNPFMQGFAPVR